MAMTSRERLMAAMRGEEVDKIPCSPRIGRALAIYYDDSDMDDDSQNYYSENVNVDNEMDNPNLFPPDGDHKGKRHSKTISARSIQNGIILALEKCPHNTCTTKSLTKRVLKELGIITRGNPRLELEKRVKRNVVVLVQKGHVQEYKAKNNRLRLLQKNI